MPELPEVETVRIGLRALLPKRRIADVAHDWPKSFPNAEADVQHFLTGATVQDVRRRAKVLIIDLDTEYSLVIHLKMTGQLVFRSKNPPRASSSGPKSPDSGQNPPLARRRNTVTPPPQERILSQNSGNFALEEMSWAGSSANFGAGHPSDSLVGDLPDKSTRVIFTFEDDSKLFFNDQRKFGWVRLLPTLEVENLDFFKKVGPEPLSDDFTAHDFIARLMRRKTSGIKAVLLDQTVVAGIGNIYADESLWAAKIHPETKVQDVPKTKLTTLHKDLRNILRLAIEKGGSTDRNYVNHEGKRGSYLTFAQVFRREGQTCPRHPDTKIIKIRVAGRGTHICPKCQLLSTTMAKAKHSAHIAAKRV